MKTPPASFPPRSEAQHTDNVCLAPSLAAASPATLLNACEVLRWWSAALLDEDQGEQDQAGKNAEGGKVEDVALVAQPCGLPAVRI